MSILKHFINRNMYTIIALFLCAMVVFAIVIGNIYATVQEIESKTANFDTLKIGNSEVLVKIDQQTRSIDTLKAGNKLILAETISDIKKWTDSIKQY